ncbi:transglycosylase [Mycolicibacterium sp. (ex Dasyatis americana)]|uniref:Transglycosylase n=1 Tax=Mycobacterium syngnathidarum TaxID=1908205 RepID=A0A1S1KI70_9MYCO|nr:MULTISPECIES: GlsB/YeaQ/YmgE family stress response membrane protein [Mycobacterium]OFB36075.1 transglycosylase [Mycolicibacterium sp. (ex Dasyatis americana)]MCG7606217.1 GlsB/YeaQ/YmgE family stress response membrane protein [Mycobacterium sp. CnD-18-1]OHU08116.1 transglycosylase [Mycobacterium syngnathidarum]OLT90273.1 transglycosylase [Mycobacterium syngnathidarum]TMS52227.1 GlsB/YeaQ/YmgE family stress response membrane protein [Mycobacterium sp. DBP42]
MIGAIITAVIVGAIIGALARLIMPGRQNVSTLMTVVLGIAGALIGSWLTAVVGYTNSNGGFAIIPFVVGVVVAIVLIAIYTSLTGRRGTPVGH